MTNRDVEITTRRTTTVDSMQDAFVFIMEHLDAVGPAPMVEISPVQDVAEQVMGMFGIEVVDEDGEGPKQLFEVSITNMVVEERVK